MKLLFENWQKFINEETMAFHGAGMEPEEMSRKGDMPPCAKPPADNPEHGWADKQWSTDDKGKGCPDFSHDRGIGLDHPDIKQAVEYLDNIMDPGDKLIAYSRGGAVALAALSRSKNQPHVVFVAPAWRRGWVNGIENPKYSNGVIIHGTADESVPLWHSADLSLKTGMDLYIFDGMKHINILRYKANPKTGRKLSREDKEKIMRSAKDQGAIGEQTEPFQKKVKAKHKRMKIRLIGKGKGKHTAGSYKEKPSYKRSKSAPPGG
jgi:hypothetical protein